MPSSKTGSIRYERASALILLVFAGGSILDAIFGIAHLAGSFGFWPIQFMAAAIPLLIATGTWVALRNQKELSGACFIMFAVAFPVWFVEIASVIPVSWYLGAGLVMWSMRLGQNLLMWVGTSLLVLAAGAQFHLINYTGAMYLPFVITVPVFLCVAAYFQWHQVRAQAQEIDLDAQEKAELHLKRYGRLPNE
ncbi:hypothetical protein [Paeniglutamicibacter kerguelensis]|uniref:Uncharacterized protein n=1 Tax=Paeniglutamicibacter kerguelensis TaxID=254788 RepID=A0ABS4XF46_9MICC|nr:hypothetical protein [Paeniglutamicibacter kerguelensis]MBP2386936.1 hypothetical protein [Paeniglutamicibacter kerguelensis]